MKKILINTITFTIILSFLLIPVSQLNAGSDSYELPPVYVLFGNVGYDSKTELTAAIGFRYWFFGVSLGLAGFAKNLPAFRKDVIIKESEIGSTETFTKMVFHGDVNLYWDLNPKVSLFGMVGYYSKSDSILARKVYQITDPDNYYYKYKANTSSGFCFGIGGHYFFESQLLIGLGYHSISGFFAQVGYWWD